LNHTCSSRVYKEVTKRDIFNIWFTFAPSNVKNTCTVHKHVANPFLVLECHLVTDKIVIKHRVEDFCVLALLLISDYEVKLRVSTCNVRNKRFDDSVRFTNNRVSNTFVITNDSLTLIYLEVVVPISTEASINVLLRVVVHLQRIIERKATFLYDLLCELLALHVFGRLHLLGCYCGCDLRQWTRGCCWKWRHLCFSFVVFECLILVLRNPFR